jgi:Na+/H+-translocating membrane pyrophosphatase
MRPARRKGKQKESRQRRAATLAIYFLVLRSRYTAIMKYVIYILLAAIVVSLGSGLYYLRREDADSPKMLRALQVRVALSLVLVVVLVASFFFGWIEQPAR